MHLFAHHMPAALVLSPDSWEDVRRRQVLARRQQGNERKLVTIIILACLMGLILLTLLYLVIRAFRFRHANKKKGGNTQTGNRGWFSGLSLTGRGRDYQQAHDADAVEASTGRRNRTSVRFAPAAGDGNASSNTTSTIDRNTSVRSVMTLPAYRAQALENEQVIGREGERDGVDVVVENPTAEEDEERREREMASLYEIRVARRQEIVDREERRRERQDARTRNDVVALQNIRDRTRAASNNSVLEELRRDHERLKNERQRAVSSVSYGDLGVARHDGTRLRANSNESERMGLLSDAASIAATSTRSGIISPMQHQRAASSGSVLSFDSDLPSPGLPRSRASSRPSTPRLNTRAGSSPEIIEPDSDMPLHSPPGYEDVSLEDTRSGATTPHNEPPPVYSGPAQRRASQLVTEMSDLAAGRRSPTDRRADEDSPSPRSGSTAPQLPQLRLQPLPQIVIEPSSARPQDD
ncbi:hypothetical protein HYQ45_014449 [Verticillium longisporum]|uniref:Uncharacterized protein n=1 Tax=Verticillium longisporum TaxID=100787 RepID=A0A8I3AJW3_VERLO|nr:hypothetical protein HYQ45_014449 [Verticillium longisporum]